MIRQKNRKWKFKGILFFLTLLLTTDLIDNTWVTKAWSFTNNFEDEKAGNWVPIGGLWKVVTEENGNKIYTQMITPGDNTISYLSGEGKDYTYKFKAKRNGGQWFATVLRLSEDNRSYYRIFFDFWGKMVTVQKTVNGSETVLTRWSYNFDDAFFNAWHIYKVEAKGNEIILWIDENKAGEYVDVSNPLLEGKIGLATCNAEKTEGTYYFDDFEVDHYTQKEMSEKEKAEIEKLLIKAKEENNKMAEEKTKEAEKESLFRETRESLLKEKEIALVTGEEIKIRLLDKGNIILSAKDSNNTLVIYRPIIRGIWKTSNSKTEMLKLTSWKKEEKGSDTEILLNFDNSLYNVEANVKLIANNKYGWIHYEYEFINNDNEKKSLEVTIAAEMYPLDNNKAELWFNPYMKQSPHPNKNLSASYSCPELAYGGTKDIIDWSQA